MPVAAISLHPDALIRKSMSQCPDGTGARTAQSRDSLTISEFRTCISSENGACPKVGGEVSRRKAVPPAWPYREVRRLAEAMLLPEVSLTCYHLPVKWQTPLRIFRSLSFSQTPFPTQNSILAQPGSRVSAKLVGMFTPQNLCISQFLETPHKWIKIAAPVCQLLFASSPPVAPSLSNTAHLQVFVHSLEP